MAFLYTRKLRCTQKRLWISSHGTFYPFISLADWGSVCLKFVKCRTAFKSLRGDFMGIVPNWLPLACLQPHYPKHQLTELRHQRQDPLESVFSPLSPPLSVCVWPHASWSNDWLCPCYFTGGAPTYVSAGNICSLYESQEAFSLSPPQGTLEYLIIQWNSC